MDAKDKLKMEKIAKTLKSRFAARRVGGKACLGVNFGPLCGEQADLFDDLPDDLPKSKVN